MKLTLALKEGVSILAITGAVDMQNFAILKAGITKIFRDGKNRIALDLTGVEKLDTEVIREIAILDILARELAGRIALIIGTPDLKQHIVSFSRPPIVPIFDSEAQMLDFFRKEGKEEAEEPLDNTKELKKVLKVKDQEIESLQAQLKQLDPSELTKAREEAARFQVLNKELTQQLKEMMLDRRRVKSEDVKTDKIAALETELKELTDRLRTATKGAS